MPFETTTLERRPDLESRAHGLGGGAWPTFLLHADLPYWSSLFDVFAPFQVLFLDPDDDPVALGHTIPFVWDGTLEDLPDTIDGAGGLMARAMDGRRARREPNALSALAAIVAPEHRRRGLSAELLRAMRSLAAERGMRSLVAPVRPTLKSLYPLTPIDRYARWKREDGSAFDPWLRVHYKLGAEYLKTAPEALTVTGTVSEWGEWTGMSFPESGDYVLPDALEPLRVDLERDEGRCKDPNVWMRHPVQEVPRGTGDS